MGQHDVAGLYRVVVEKVEPYQNGRYFVLIMESTYISGEVFWSESRFKRSFNMANDDDAATINEICKRTGVDNWNLLQGKSFCVIVFMENGRIETCLAGTRSDN